MFKQCWELEQIRYEGISGANDELRKENAALKELYDHALKHEAHDHEQRRDAEHERDEIRASLAQKEEEVKRLDSLLSDA